MTGPRRIQENPMYAIIDAAIRKDISWREARARLRALARQHPELFDSLDQDLIDDLELDE